MEYSNTKVQFKKKIQSFYKITYFSDFQLLSRQAKHTHCHRSSVSRLVSLRHLVTVPLSTAAIKNCRYMLMICFTHLAPQGRELFYWSFNKWTLIKCSVHIKYTHTVCQKAAYVTFKTERRVVLKSLRPKIDHYRLSTKSHCISQPSLRFQLKYRREQHDWRV